jgi:hypothetical protein
MLACDHERNPFGSQMCIHLRTCRDPWIDCVKWYTGSGCNAELLCVPCVQKREPGAREVIVFAGPAGRFFSDSVSLFSSDQTGLSRWDPVEGVRTAQVPDFQPSHYHRGSGEMVQLTADVLLRCILK